MYKGLNTRFIKIINYSPINTLKLRYLSGPGQSSPGHSYGT